MVQEGANERRRAQEDAAARKIEADAADERVRQAAAREAENTDLLEGARLRAERERAEIQGAMPPTDLKSSSFSPSPSWKTSTRMP